MHSMKSRVWTQFSQSGWKIMVVVILLLTMGSGFGQTIEIKTSALKRVLKIDNNRVKTVTLVNQLTGETFPVESKEFSLHFFVGGWANASFDPNPKLLTGDNFILQAHQAFQSGDTSGYLFELLNEANQIKVVLRYFTVARQPEIRKQLQISTSSTYKHLLDFVEVENLQIFGATVSHQGFGQPVYAGNFFLGLEYPAGYNQADEAGIRLRHYAGEEISQTAVKSQVAVLGAAPAGKLTHYFLDYIERIKAQPTRPFLLYNSWYDIRTLTDENCAETIDGFKKYMLEPYGLKLDAFVLDDGWDNYESSWDISAEQFPRGFLNVQKKLKEIDAYLGIWASPWGGYGERREIRVNWARAHGYETSGDMLCLAGEKYGQHFLSTLSRYQQAYDIHFFKLDGLLTRCNELNHGHLPGLYAQEAEIARFIQVLKELRKNNPQVFIDITVGTWLSPWWLMYADCVWMTGADYAYTEDLPTFSERDKAITYRDKVLHDNYLVSNYQFPFSGLMTHGIIKGRLNLLGGENEPLRKFTDNAVIYFSRGVMMWELYITPSILSKQEWDNLAATIHWAYDNVETLKQTRFILGDPSRGEVYGYLHKSQGKTLVTLRNPFLFPQSVSLSRELLWPEDVPEQSEVMVSIQYPYRKAFLLNAKDEKGLELIVEGNEVLSLEVVPISAVKEPAPLEVVYSAGKVGENDQLLLFPEHAVQTVAVFLPKGYQIVQSPEIDIEKGSRSLQNVHLKESGAMPRPTVQDVQYGMRGNEFVLRFTAEISNRESENKLLLLIDSAEELDTLETRASVRDEKIPVEIKKDANARWWWVSLPVPAETSNVEVRIWRPDRKACQATFHAVLENVSRLSGGVVMNLKVPKKQPAETKRLPAFENELRKTIPLVKNFQVGK